MSHFGFSIGDFRFSIGDLWRAEDGPLAIEDTGQGTSGTQKECLLAGDDACRAYDRWRTDDRALAIEDTGGGTSATQKECLLAGDDTGPGTGGARSVGRARSKTLVRGPVAPKKNASLRATTLVGGPGAHGGWVTRDRRHWWGHQCHPNKDTRRGISRVGRRGHSRSKTLVGAPVAPKKNAYVRATTLVGGTTGGTRSC